MPILVSVSGLTKNGFDVLVGCFDFLTRWRSRDCLSWISLVLTYIGGAAFSLEAKQVSSQPGLERWMRRLLSLNNHWIRIRSWRAFWDNCIGYANNNIFSSKRKQSFQEESHTANRRKKGFPATDSNKTNSRTAERRSTPPQVITPLFLDDKRVKTRFRANQP